MNHLFHPADLPKAAHVCGDHAGEILNRHNQPIGPVSDIDRRALQGIAADGTAWRDAQGVSHQGPDVGEAISFSHVDPFRFFTGLHIPAHARHFARCCISVNRLWRRKAPVLCDEVLVDSGAFTTLVTHGYYPKGVEEYAARLIELKQGGIVKICAAVAQDFMCEAFMLKKTGMSVAEHQRLTIERYDQLVDAVGGAVPIMPVLQGYAPIDYARHAEAYGDRLSDGMWVGVGSVCKRNGKPERIVEVLTTIRHVRPDIRLHGFGVKRTALLHPGVVGQLSTADSMAWSFSARKQGRNGNSYLEALAFERSVLQAARSAGGVWQIPLPF